MNTITILLMAWTLAVSSPNEPTNRTLRVGESATITIEAKEAYNNTKLLLVKNGRYGDQQKANGKMPPAKSQMPMALPPVNAAALSLVWTC